MPRPSVHRSVVLLLAFVLAFALVAMPPFVAWQVVAASEPIRIVIDGTPVQSDVAPRILNGRTMVPIRVISEHLGAQVSWDGGTRTVSVVVGTRRIHLGMGSPTALVDGNPVTLDVPASIVAGRTLVPLRFIGEALGARVSWDPQQRQVTVKRSRAVLTEISVKPDQTGGKIVLHLTAPAAFTAQVLPRSEGKPDRIEITLKGTDVGLPLTEFAVGIGGIFRGRARALPGGEGAVVVFELSEPAAVDVHRAANGRDIVVAIGYKVVGLRYGNTEYGPAVFIEADGPVTARSFSLDGPDRIVVDVQGVTLSERLPATMEISDPLVKRLRAGQFDPQTVRVVIDLERPTEHTLLTQGNVVVVQLRKRVTGVDGPGENGKGATLTGRTIVVDPGHGGKDPGSIGYRGTHEKDLVLAVGRRLRELLTGAGARVVMTRDDDRWVDLYERAGIANQVGADAFVSLHANWFRDPNLAGLETYSYPGSAEGRRLATLIQGEMLRALGRPDRGVRVADFVVLRETKMPAALVEMGYLSNPDEERLLTDANVQLRIAEAIFRAIVAFFGQ